MRIPSFSTPRRARVAGMLMVCSILVPACVARADDDPESLDIMDRQMEHLQQQQMALQNDLMAMRQQIAHHRAQMGGGSAGSAHPLQVTGSGGHVRGGWVPSEGHAATARMAAGTEVENGGRAPHIGGRTASPFVPVDEPTLESVVAHREEDLISHMANNNVGPHNRETVGAQSAGCLLYTSPSPRA